VAKRKKKKAAKKKAAPKPKRKPAKKAKGRAKPKPKPKKKAAKKRPAKKKTASKPKKKSAKKKAVAKPKKKPAKKKPAKKPKAKPKKKPAKKKPAPKPKKKPAKKKPAKKSKAKPKKKPAKKKPKAKSGRKSISAALGRLLDEARGALQNPDLPKRAAADVRDRLSAIVDPLAIPSLLSMLGPGDPHDIRSEIIYLLDSFPENDYFPALLDALPKLTKSAPGWAFVALVRIINTRDGGKKSCAARFEQATRGRGPRMRALVSSTLERHRGAVERPTAKNIGLSVRALKA
jgi:hypothetical protein